ncbi:hypothetical protein CL614_00095 [archaeon]|nr:hypothetical protein [archaeon]|tara:strand:+ start:245 stop:553 length:309 start_codon:yes stop_codon:yes gene_type:complete
MDCKVCGKELIGKQKMFCSYKCTSIYRSGENSPSFKNPPNKGKKFNEAWRKNLSESHKGKNTGENHPMYGKHHKKQTEKDKNRQLEIMQKFPDFDFIRMRVF